ncbi:GNAT family protein [Amycolatopsis endophytica]|uniref:RimJ/RimL family protein N-acetyltransferase n=1 Tax=Amycolatopsis endophytica TaxID=860233 RepID=A0A853BG36_9PSEU|nr:GNAT family protein [Amycolatopsis endophytica]NYI93486.1 RimJ/RimL family protein N-acetyltransferase [Amycolatopsis endophytica]
MVIADQFPVFGLRIRTPRLELRLPDSDELSALAGLAADGVHDPGVQPFIVTWTDQEPELVARSVVQYFWRRLGGWTPRDWGLDLAVFRDGEVVGQQTVNGRDLAITREVHTGSWIGRRYQGQGIGTEMRAAVLHLAFEALGADEAVSGAFEDNAASLAVSRKLGYRPDGTARHVVRGKLAIERRLRLTREAWRGGVPVTIEGFQPCRPLFGL